jgi:Holliday junction resolvase RusA-like endonuclease
VVDPVYFVVKAVPALCLNPNRSRKAHWSELASAIAHLRQSTCYDVMSQGFPAKLIGYVDVYICLCWPAANRKLRDVSNLAHMTKPIFDGMADAGLVDDDDQFYPARIEQFVMTKLERAHYPHGATVIAVTPGEPRATIPPIDRNGHVTQAWLDGIPR